MYNAGKVSKWDKRHAPEVIANSLSKSRSFLQTLIEEKKHQKNINKTFFFNVSSACPLWEWLLTPQSHFLCLS